MAVAAFSKDDIEIIQAEKRVTVKAQTKPDGAKTYLYRGLSARPFAAEFDLAEYVEVTGADLDNGLPVIALKRELPEAISHERFRSISEAAACPLAPKRKRPKKDPR